MKDHNELNTIRDSVGHNASKSGFSLGKGNLVSGCRAYAATGTTAAGPRRRTTTSRSEASITDSCGQSDIGAYER
jgi:hypothetical protein